MLVAISIDVLIQRGRLREGLVSRRFSQSVETDACIVP
jgi:hypothetical protein